MASNITGLYGCSCHPFPSWDECKKAHSQKLGIGDKTRHRCNGREGEVFSIENMKGFVVVKYGPVESDKQLHHVAMLTKL